MKVEILDGFHQPESRQSNDGKVRWSQKAYLHNGGAFPVEFTLSIPDASSAYPVGQYTLTDDSFKVNQYGGLELSRWDLKLTPLANELKKVS